MKALTLQAIKSPLVFEERPDSTPSAGEVVVRLQAAAVNRRDYWIAQGMYPGIETPVVLGSDGAGVVSRTGSGVESGWQGREVILNPGLNWGRRTRTPRDRLLRSWDCLRDGTFATEVTVDASQLHGKPPPSGLASSRSSAPGRPPLVR